MEEVDKLIEKYAKKIESDLDDEKEERYATSQNVNALAALITARASHYVAFRTFKRSS